MNSQIAPTLSSGFERRGTFIVALMVFLTAVYTVLYFALKDSHTYLPAASEYCPSATEPCARPDLFAFQIGSGIAIAYCGVKGFLTWHVTKRAHLALPSTPEGRLYGYLEESEMLAAVFFSFQVWDFFVSLMIPEHTTLLFLAHHVMSAVVSYLCIKHQVLHYYSVFFLGVTEFSSMFLVLVDLAMYFPPNPGSWFDFIITIICRPAFAAAFFWYRVKEWWKVSYLLWSDANHVISTGASEQLRPGKSYVLYTFLAMNLPLGVLQLYWFRVILTEAANVLQPL